MSDSKKEISIFKEYLKPSIVYRGGKTLDEIDPNIKVYKLSSNENMLGSSPKAIQAIKDALDKLHFYPDRTDTRLQIALENYYNGKIKQGQFITGPSGSEVIELVIRAFMGEGLECIISNPAFLVYQMFAEKMGSKVVDIPLTQPNFDVDWAGILNAINDNTRIVFLTSPNNPTGSYIPEKELDDFLNKIPDHVVVVLDEVYFQYADAKDYTTAVKYVLQGKNIIGLNSFSKAYGLAGLRVGYAYTNEKIAKYVRQLYKPFLVNILALEAAIAALEDKEFLDQTVSLVQKEKEFIYKKLDELSVQYWKSQANFILIKPKISEYEFENKMFQHGVMVRPVSNFGAPECVRITIGTREANEQCLAAIEKIYQSE